MFTLILHAVHSFLGNMCFTNSQGRDKNISELSLLSQTAFSGLSKMGVSMEIGTKSVFEKKRDQL